MKSGYTLLWNTLCVEARKKGNSIKDNFKSYPLRPEQSGCGCTGLEEGFPSKGE